MKIAFFLNRFPMLSQTFVLNQITGLIDRGHEVDIYAIRPENNTKMHADVTKYNLLNLGASALNCSYSDIRAPRSCRLQ